MTPARIWNRPNLPQIAYRVGTFPTFRRAMLDDLARRLPEWQERPGNPDYATVVLELWAYAGDVLTFYQERIANETYLGTATQLDSLRRLVELTGYRPSPGAAATALLAFTAEGGRAAVVPTGIRVASRPAAERPAVTFETQGQIVARAEHNAIPLAARAPANQFAPEAALDAVARGVATPADLRAVFPALADAFIDPAASAQVGPGVPSRTSDGNPAAPTRTVAFNGTGLNLAEGTYLLVFDAFDSGGAPRGNGHLRQVAASIEDAAASVTHVTWAEDPAQTWGPVQKVFVLRAAAAPFGSSVTWVVPGSLPDLRDRPQELYLDRPSAGIVASAPDLPRFAVLLDTSLGSQSQPWQRLHRTMTIAAVDDALHTLDDGSSPPRVLSQRIARLVLNRPIEADLFRRDSTLVLLESEPLELSNLLAVRQPVTGARLVLAGVYPNLATGQQVIVTGERLSDGEVQSEAVLVTAAQTDAATSLTIVTVRPPLVGVFRRSATEVLANVARANHGETVADEILGSGDGTAWQSFTLASSPLTYVLATGTDDAPVESTLRVTVNGVVWQEVANLGAAAAGDRVYATSQDQAGVTTVHFGDQTARPPTGQNNVHAHYRFGIGTAGTLPANALVQLVDSVPGLQSVTNPQPTGGAADPESRDEIRAKAPAGASTFGRAVSPADYAALALAYPGVSAARASWVRIDATGVLPRPELRITLVGPHRTALSAETITMLRRYLDERRDVNVPLRLVSFTPAYVDVVARVDVNDDYGRQATLRLAQAALAAEPAPDGSVGLFGRISFGESVPLSSVYAALQAVPGVRDAVVTTLRNPALDPVGTVRDEIPVRAGELAVIGDDPADRDNRKGRLTIQLGTGGFAD